MNKEIIKAMNKKEKKRTFRKWWGKNGYKVIRTILFPVWIACLIAQKIQKRLNERAVWSKERAKQILDYYIPRRAEWSEEDKTFYLFDNGMGWSIYYAKKYLKRKDRRWWKNHSACWGGAIRTYLIEEFELEGFTKIVGDCSNYTELSFVMKEKK